MKNSLYILTLGLLLGILFLTACQSGDLSNEDSGLPVVSRTDSCYLNLQIVDNTKPTTRATIAATAAENAVYDGILAIFEGNGESAATLKSAVVIDQLINNPGNSSSITVTQRLAGTHNYNGNKLYALVLLNTTSTGFNVQNNMLYLNGTSLSGKTRAEIQSMTINSVGSPDEHVGLYMTNTVKDDNTVLRIIYHNDPSQSSYLYDTPEAAASGNRLTINVERAAAKVSVTKPNTLVLSNINLNGNSSTHPTVHAMTWTLNKYNVKSYAIRNGSTSTANWAQDWNYVSTAPEKTFSARDFAVYPQHSHSNDVVYIAENTTSDGSSSDANLTEAIVEVQLKDNNSMLMHECYTFAFGNPQTDLYTSGEQYLTYLRNGLPPANKGGFNLGDVDNADIFKYATIGIQSDGSVKITLVNSDLTAFQQGKLTELAGFLSENTTGYRDGKMYYTYKIKHNDTPTYGVVRNNAYNLTLTGDPRIGSPAPPPIE